MIEMIHIPNFPPKHPRAIELAKVDLSSETHTFTSEQLSELLEEAKTKWFNIGFTKACDMVHSALVDMRRR